MSRRRGSIGALPPEMSGGGQRKENEGKWWVSTAVGGLGAAAVTAFIAARVAGPAAAAGIGLLVILGGRASQYLNIREPSKKDFMFYFLSVNENYPRKKS
ncbi:hypothetical protein R3I93_003913 [Phoxinus phoxinus]|uniref:Uncharacterized protein n=1 Tax=Phoxinus phoxinus TaxID=58324 RepID=A0AAN9DEA4_9TELE